MLSTIHSYITRAFSTSVFEFLVISVAVVFTMPSVGINFVGCRKYFNSAGSSFGALGGAERSTAKFLVVIRLVAVSAGTTPVGNSAAMIPSESGVLSISFAVPPSALKSFASVF